MYVLLHTLEAQTQPNPAYTTRYAGTYARNYTHKHHARRGGGRENQGSKEDQCVLLILGVGVDVGVELKMLQVIGGN